MRGVRGWGLPQATLTFEADAVDGLDRGMVARARVLHRVRTDLQAALRVGPERLDVAPPSAAGAGAGCVDVLFLPGADAGADARTPLGLAQELGRQAVELRVHLKQIDHYAARLVRRRQGRDRMAGTWPDRRARDQMLGRGPDRRAKRESKAYYG